MPTIAQVRDGLADAITAGCGLRASGYMTDNVPHPVAHVFRGEMDPRMVMGKAKAAYPFIARVFVGRAAEVAAQKRLDELTEPTGAGSLVAAVEDGDNWSVDVDYAVVTSIGAVQNVLIADESVLFVDFEIEVCF